MLLADQGADVLKIEPLEGDPLRGSTEFSVWNRGKKLIKLDIFSQDSAPILHKLISGVDALIENLDPNTAKSLTISYNDLEKDYPKLIYVTLPGFPEGHEYQHIPPDEYLVSSASGIYTLSPSGEQPVEGEGPSFHELYYSSTFAAITAAPAFVAAILHRDSTNRGQKITVPMHDAMYQGMGTALVRHSERNHGRQVGHPIVKRFYQCKDGAWVNINFDIPRFLEPFLKFTGHENWIEFFQNLDFSQIDNDTKNYWSDKLDTLWKTQSADQWENQLAELGLPCTRCRTMDEWLALDHSTQSETVITTQDPVFGEMKHPGLLVSSKGRDFSPTPANPIEVL